MKGQKSRAGAKAHPRIRELIKRYPKLRGYRTQSQKRKILAVNVEILEKNFENGETVNPSILVKKNIVKRIKGNIPKVKILGRGELTKALTIEGCEVSESGAEKIKKAGGTIT